MRAKSSAQGGSSPRDPAYLPTSPLGEALTYRRNQMRHVAQYIRDGRPEIDNGVEP